jgi:hypothetical protein
MMIRYAGGLNHKQVSCFLECFSDKIGLPIERGDNNILNVAKALREKDERQ